ncbi:Lactose transport system permease protein LacF [Paraliobacillus sp. PM-2]|uniref:carbohydrate ABC transporter permease n=1 Tax=Paraliobacillus sp. PM-2 TaxID=1462524 RepID=UPI00061CAC05|nr:sugar ABC transporter permease [Paraliobacillus sp. PM-2]CQR47231.1 Lactose transport system permease protein LacF [Paraliobacillus sp. PM-2]
MSDTYVAVNKSKLKNKKNLVFWCWLFITPNLIFYAAFQGWPIVMNIYNSMMDWSGLGNATFIGLDNFKELVTDSYFWKSYGNSFVFMAGSVPPLMIFSLIAALIVNNPKLKFATAYRTIIFIPVITTASIVGIIMVYIWGSDGAVNAALSNLPFVESTINWLGSSKWAMFAVIAVFVWKNLGMNMIYWLAALQGVPRQLLEAAEIDGAGVLQKFFYVTLPQIIPIGAVILLVNISSTLRAFDLIKTMTNGGPSYSTDVISTYIYRFAFSSEMGLPRLGYASAAATLFALTIAIIAITTTLIRRSNNTQRRVSK